MRESNKPPALVPNKAAYIQADIHRASKLFQVPIKTPEFFWEFIATKSTVKSQRLLVALQLKHPRFLEEVSRVFWKRFYQENEDIAEEDSVAAVGQVIGMDAASLEETLRFMNDGAVRGSREEHV
ncbi:unnamed protein product [Ixodes hexagonus]